MPKINEIQQETYAVSSPMPAGMQHMPNPASVGLNSLANTVNDTQKLLMHMNNERKETTFQRYNYMFEATAEALERDYATAPDYSNFDNLRESAFKNFQSKIKDEEFGKAYLNRYGAGLNEALKLNMNKNKAKKEVTLYNIELDKTLTSSATMAATAPNLDERKRHIAEARFRIANSSFLSPEQKEKSLSNFEDLLVKNKKTAMENLIYNDLPRAEEAQKNNFFGFDGETLTHYVAKLESAKKEDNIIQKIRLNDDVKLAYENIKSYWKSGEPVPAEVISAIQDKKMKEGVLAKDFARKQGGDVETNANLYYRLENMAKDSPAAFKTYNIYQHIGELADEDIANLEERQAGIRLNKDGKPYVAQEKNIDTALKNALFDELKIKDPQDKLYFEKKLRKAIQDAETKKGFKLTLSEQDEVASQFKKSVNMRGLFSFDKNVWEISEDNVKNVYLDYDDIDSKTKAAIMNSLRKEHIDLKSFNSKERERLFEDIAGALLLPPALKSKKIRDIYKTTKERLLNEISSVQNKF